MLCANIIAYVSFLIAFVIESSNEKDDILPKKKHITKAALQKSQEVNLWCYTCTAFDMDDNCVDLKENQTHLIKKCVDNNRICRVKRFSYKSTTANSTMPIKMWSIERKCVSECEPGCIVIGERTKLYSCVSCCTSSLCNVGNNGNHQYPVLKFIITMLFFLYF